MAYNDDLAAATTMAPQLGTLTSSTTPTLTQANTIWDRSFDRVRAALLINGVAAEFEEDSVAEGWVRRLEMFLTSGDVLQAKETIGPQRTAESWHASQQLIKTANTMLDELPAMRQVLIDNGGSEHNGSADSRMGSHWIRAKNPDWDPTPGGPDVPYADTPVFPDGSDL